METYADSEKKDPVDGTSEGQSKIDFGHGIALADISAEDDRRVRWKIDCVVLPVSIQELAESLDFKD